MATDYNYYYTRAMQDYQPALDAEVNRQRAALADQGLYASTAGQGTLADIRNKYVSSARQTAQESALNREQFAANAAMKVWEMLSSAALQRKEVMGGTGSVRLPGQPASFADYSQSRFLPPTQGYGNIGDGKGAEYWPMYNGLSGSTSAERNAAADRALSAARLKLDQDMFDYQKAKDGGDDPWAKMSAIATTNLDDADPTGSTAGYQARYHPSVLLAKFKVDYGIDVLTEARDPKSKNYAKAVEVMKILYPTSWRARVSGVDPTAATADHTTSQSAAATAPPVRSPIERAFIEAYSPTRTVPQSTNRWDALADAYSTMGRTSPAVESGNAYFARRAADVLDANGGQLRTAPLSDYYNSYLQGASR